MVDGCEVAYCVTESQKLQRFKGYVLEKDRFQGKKDFVPRARQRMETQEE